MSEEAELQRLLREESENNPPPSRNPFRDRTPLEYLIENWPLFYGEDYNSIGKTNQQIQKDYEMLQKQFQEDFEKFKVTYNNNNGSENRNQNTEINQSNSDNLFDNDIFEDNGTPQLFNNNNLNIYNPNENEENQPNTPFQSNPNNLFDNDFTDNVFQNNTINPANNDLYNSNNDELQTENNQTKNRKTNEMTDEEIQQMFENLGEGVSDRIEQDMNQKNIQSKSKKKERKKSEEIVKLKKNIQEENDPVKITDSEKTTPAINQSDGITDANNNREDEDEQDDDFSEISDSINNNNNNNGDDGNDDNETKDKNRRKLKAESRKTKISPLRSPKYKFKSPPASPLKRERVTAPVLDIQFTMDVKNEQEKQIQEKELDVIILFFEKNQNRDFDEGMNTINDGFKKLGKNIRDLLKVMVYLRRVILQIENNVISLTQKSSTKITKLVDRSAEKNIETINKLNELKKEKLDLYQSIKKFTRIHGYEYVRRNYIPKSYQPTNELTVDLVKMELVQNTIRKMEMDIAFKNTEDDTLWIESYNSKVQDHKGLASKKDALLDLELRLKSKYSINFNFLEEWQRYQDLSIEYQINNPNSPSAPEFKTLSQEEAYKRKAIQIRKTNAVFAKFLQNMEMREVFKNYMMRRHQSFWPPSLCFADDLIPVTHTSFLNSFQNLLQYAQKFVYGLSISKFPEDCTRFDFIDSSFINKNELPLLRWVETGMLPSWMKKINYFSEFNQPGFLWPMYPILQCMSYQSRLFGQMKQKLNPFFNIDGSFLTNKKDDLKHLIQWQQARISYWHYKNYSFLHKKSLMQFFHLNRDKISTPTNSKLFSDDFADLYRFNPFYDRTNNKQLQFEETFDPMWSNFYKINPEAAEIQKKLYREYFPGCKKQFSGTNKLFCWIHSEQGEVDALIEWYLNDIFVCEVEGQKYQIKPISSIPEQFSTYELKVYQKFGSTPLMRNHWFKNMDQSLPLRTGEGGPKRRGRPPGKSNNQSTTSLENQEKTDKDEQPIRREISDTFDSSVFSIRFENFAELNILFNNLFDTEKPYSSDQLPRWIGMILYSFVCMLDRFQTMTQKNGSKDGKAKTVMLLARIPKALLFGNLQLANIIHIFVHCFDFAIATNAKTNGHLPSHFSFTSFKQFVFEDVDNFPNKPSGVIEEQDDIVLFRPMFYTEELFRIIFFCMSPAFEQTFNIPCNDTLYEFLKSSTYQSSTLNYPLSYRNARKVYPQKHLFFNRVFHNSTGLFNSFEFDAYLETMYKQIYCPKKAIRFEKDCFPSIEKDLNVTTTTLANNNQPNSNYKSINVLSLKNLSKTSTKGMLFYSIPLIREINSDDKYQIPIALFNVLNEAEKWILWILWKEKNGKLFTKFVNSWIIRFFQQGLLLEEDYSQNQQRYLPLLKKIVKLINNLNETLYEQDLYEDQYNYLIEVQYAIYGRKNWLNEKDFERMPWHSFPRLPLFCIYRNNFSHDLNRSRYILNVQDFNLLFDAFPSEPYPDYMSPSRVREYLFQYKVQVSHGKVVCNLPNPISQTDQQNEEKMTEKVKIKRKKIYELYVDPKNYENSYIYDTLMFYFQIPKQKFQQRFNQEEQSELVELVKNLASFYQNKPSHPDYEIFRNAQDLVGLLSGDKFVFIQKIINYLDLNFTIKQMILGYQENNYATVEMKERVIPFYEDSVFLDNELHGYDFVPNLHLLNTSGFASKDDLENFMSIPEPQQNQN